MARKNNFWTRLIKGLEKDYKTFHAGHWVLMFAVLFSAVVFVEYNALDFRTSVISPSSFNGTTLPILKVPKWTSLTSGEWDLSYDQIPANKIIPIPKYDPNILKKSTSNLGWSSESDLNIRNSKITFSVPYMGDYTLSGIENNGSHLAVDIKLPMNTPIYAIGDGVVTKVSSQNTGFGHHIVIKHENFPSYGNSSKKETLYSSYSHMGVIAVAEGDTVTKGKYIGKSGESGTATTPHLHFQIDNANAPWHPYWPFTYQEASDAGYSFFEAINAGLGKEKALQTTVNSMMYVQKYMNGTASSINDVPPPPSTSTSTNDTSSTSEPDTSDLPPATTPDSSHTPPPMETNDASDINDSSAPNTSELPPPTTELTIINLEPAVKFEVSHDGSFVKNKPEIVTVTAIDKNGDVANGYAPDEAIYTKVIVGGVDLPTAIYPNDVKDGVAVITITPTASGNIIIKMTDGDISGESEPMTATLFNDVSEDANEYKAVSFLRAHDVIGGYPDGTFKPDDVVSRVEALKFILNGVNSDLIAAGDLPFPDTFPVEWYSTYVATAYTKEIVDGYPDSTFRPANTVNRAEFLKMLLTAMKVDLNDDIAVDVYSDVPADAWFASYVEFAKYKNLLVINDNKFRPDEGMTRAEVSELIYRTILLKISGAPKFSSGINVSSGDVSGYFS